MEHESLKAVSTELLCQREEAVNKLALISIQLCQSSAEYNLAIADILHINQLIRREENQ